MAQQQNENAGIVHWSDRWTDRETKLIERDWESQKYNSKSQRPANHQGGMTTPREGIGSAWQEQLSPLKSRKHDQEDARSRNGWTQA